MIKINPCKYTNICPIINTLHEKFIIVLDFGKRKHEIGKTVKTDSENRNGKNRN